MGIIQTMEVTFDPLRSSSRGIFRINPKSPETPTVATLPAQHSPKGWGWGVAWQCVCVCVGLVEGWGVVAPKDRRMIFNGVKGQRHL